MSTIWLNQQIVCIQLKEKVDCKVYSKDLEIKKCDTILAKHILNENLAIGCTIELVKSSGRGTSVTNGPQSNYANFSKFSMKSAETPTKSSPCTNRPIICPLCKTTFWAYLIS